MSKGLELQRTNTETGEDEETLPVILSFNKGDEIQVNDPGSEFDGCIGVVASNKSGKKGVRVRLDGFTRDNFFALKILERYSGGN